MKANDLKKIDEIDETIQLLLNELSELYTTRQSLFLHTRKTSEDKNSIESIDLSQIDLTLT